VSVVVAVAVVMVVGWVVVVDRVVEDLVLVLAVEGHGVCFVSG
jgi:hypothetical protein